MNLGRQWNDRLRIWAEQFPKHYYRMYSPVSMSYFTTMDHLSFPEAVQGSFIPTPVGMKWGRKWEYGWFQTQIRIPDALHGKRVVFTLNTAEEMLVFVNGREAGAIDKAHRYITLSRSANAGDTYEIYAECYAGHGVRREGAGPVSWGEASVPEPPEYQVTVGQSSFGEWNEALFQVAMDYLTLYSLVLKLPEKSLRAMKIIDGLKKFTYIADFELPEPEMTASVLEAGKLLHPLLDCKNGSTAPEFTVFGQSHLDLAWLWPVEETVRKSARTYANQLALMEEYGDYRFLLCEPPILEWLKERYPNVYSSVLEKVKAGKFYPEGALWVECDTNIPSGESLIRQFLWGKRWLRKELGVDAKLAWMPDTFGFSAALPQIMKKCQVPYFATQKLIRQDPEAQPFPYNLFWWEGMDGSKVLAHTFKKNNAVFSPGDLITRWEEDRVQQENIDGLIYPFGYGDGGGGPTREMVEMQRRCADLEGAPRCRVENPVRFFERYSNPENTFCGELYLAWHRGTLTSQAKTKRGIRKGEIALKQVEFVMSLRMLSGLPVEPEWKGELERLWKLLLFNQFHDVAPGTSIARVHQRAEAELEEVKTCAYGLIQAMVGLPGAVAAVLNPLPWPRNYDGVEIPPQGVAVANLQTASSRSATVVYLKAENCYELRNDHLVCRFNCCGELVSAKIPGSDREYISGQGNRFLMFKDVNTCYDAWELGSMYENMPIPLDGGAVISLENGITGASLHVKGRLNNSGYHQVIFLGNNSKRLEFVTEVDWQEQHKLLKVAFPVNIFTREAIHEVQFGYVKRPNHRSYPTDRDRYEVCNHRYTALCESNAGAAVLNDGKYGVSAADNEIRLSLLKSAKMPDMNADRGVQTFRYAFYPFSGSLTESNIVREATELNEPLIFGDPKICPSGPVFLPDSKNIIVEAVKPADTVENALLVRAYEAMGMRTVTAVRIAEKVAKIVETDMLEENATAVSTAHVEFGPFEIKTFLLYL